MHNVNVNVCRSGKGIGHCGQSIRAEYDIRDVIEVKERGDLEKV